jgi:hypothetical protein
MAHELTGNFFKASSLPEYEALQLALFDKGCQWGVGQSLKNDHFTVDRGYDGYATISVTEDGRMWRDDDGVEGKISYKTVCIATVEAAPKRATVDGKTYNLDDLLEAIRDAGIEEVE